jgi:glycosyltransferase involved in cell wall biosynthesis
MKILQLHNRYQIIGGEEGVVQAEHQLLTDHGHTVHLLEVTNDRISSPTAKISAAIGAIYSRQAKQQVLREIRTFRPDLVHVHNFFPLLSPSIYDACRSAHIPVVQTLHNYRLICPKAMLFRDQQICEACVGKPIALQGIRSGCYRESSAQTAIVAAMLAIHTARGTWRDRVNAYIALTQFQKQKLVQGGLPAHKIHVKPNFVDLPVQFSGQSETPPRENFVLFVGRLAEEKGVGLLIDAYTRDPNLPPLKLVGDGPLADVLKTQVLGANMTDRITFLGRQDKAQVLYLMHRAQLLVFPSIWYEGFPLTLAEAFACGLPAIVPNLGSMAEIVEPNITGFHFTPQSSLDLLKTLRSAIANPTHLTRLSHNARQVYQTHYTGSTNYDRLISIYSTSVYPPHLRPHDSK